MAKLLRMSLTPGLRRHPVARRVQGWIFAGLLAGFGLGLAIRG
ncbi:MAG: hypothetical protein PGN34_17710 [Methylobacterium frigidaeris]